MNHWPELERFLQTDPRDVGCEQATELLHVYVELILDDETGREAQRRYPGLVAHFLACPPCGEDFAGLLAAVGGSAQS